MSKLANPESLPQIMSCIKSGQFYVLISSSDKTRKLFKVFPTLTRSRILVAAAEFGILGKYLVSAEDNVIIADNPALHYYIQKGHMIMVVESLENHDVRYIQLEEIGESETDDDLPGSQGAKEEQFLRLKHISSQLGHVEGSLNDFINNFGSAGDNIKSFQSSN